VLAQERLEVGVDVETVGEYLAPQVGVLESLREFDRALERSNALSLQWIADRDQYRLPG